MVSAKARGKQRAISGSDSDSHRDPAQETDENRRVVVRFTDGIPDLEISIHKSESTKELKRQVGPFLAS